MKLAARANIGAVADLLYCLMYRIVSFEKVLFVPDFGTFSEHEHLEQ